jgi:hypothetical protein
MSRLNAVFVSVFAAAALVAATVALAQTLHLGAAANKTSSRLLVKRAGQLDRFEASLQLALARKPPPLPAVPVVRAPVVKPPPPVVLPTPAPVVVAAPTAPPPQVQAAAPAPALVAASTPRVVYRRPPPIIVHVHRHGAGEGQGSQQEAGDGGD